MTSSIASTQTSTPVWLLVASALLSCADLADAPSSASHAQVAAPTAETRVVHLVVSDASGRTKRHPYVLSGDGSGRWSTAFHLLCEDCAHALSAFGYTAADTQYATEYTDEAQLIFDARLEGTPITELTLEANAREPAILAAFRVVDAQADDPRYVVRLRAVPDALYRVDCENFLRAGQGSLDTLPITRSLLRDHWKPALPLPRIGCSLQRGKLLGAPAPAQGVRSTAEVPPVIEVWNVETPHPGVSSTRYPYLVTRDAAGVRRGYAIDCGSEAPVVLRAFGFELSDVRSALATDAELEATRFGAQPVIGCAGIGGRTITRLTSADDLDRVPRFQFGIGAIVEFGCPEAARFWSARASATLEVPLATLAHLDDAHGAIGATTTFQLGCRAVLNPALARLDGQVLTLRKQSSASAAAPFGLCIDARSASFDPGVRFQSYPCNGSSAQTFVLGYRNAGHWELRRNGTSLCLTTAGAQAQSPVTQAPCDGSAAQRFQLEPHLEGLHLRAAGTSLCVDVPGNSNAVDTLLQLWECNRTPAQTFAPVAPRFRRSGGGDLCLDGSAGGSDPLRMVDCDDSEPQNWQIGVRRDGNVELRRNTTGLCLTVGRAEPGQRLTQAPCNDSAPQSFGIEVTSHGRQDGTGSYLRFSGTGLCLDVPSNSQTSGTPLQLWPCNKSAAQTFGL